MKKNKEVKMSKEALVAKANRPAEIASKMHAKYRGKMETIPKCKLTSIKDFAVWYTPGVARPCLEINKNKELAYEYTNKWNTIAVISDGSRVLGLGNIGPEAAMPVMEGKSMIFKYLGGVDAIPLCLGTQDMEEFIRTVKLLQPSLGGINLEDIEHPKCFEILERLRNECEIPVWHDDQQGTATVTVAGLINALKIVNKKFSDVKIALIGAGAANICIANLLILRGVTAGNIIMCDSRGTLHKGRTELKVSHKEKWAMCEITNSENIIGAIPDAIKGADVLIALSTPGPDVIKKEWVTTMAKDSIVFACANPVPEIWPWDAKEAGARIVATGRSDFPNQVNNSVGFPGIFRGVLDVRAKTITDEMCIAAANELARIQEEEFKMDEEHILPKMDNLDIFAKEAVAVGMKAIEQGVAKFKMSPKELLKKSSAIIKLSQEKTKFIQKRYIK